VDDFSAHVNGIALPVDRFARYVNDFSLHVDDFSPYVNGFAAHVNDFARYVNGFVGYGDDFSGYTLNRRAALFSILKQSNERPNQSNYRPHNPFPILFYAISINRNT
jgi:hypothetical protein